MGDPDPRQQDICLRSRDQQDYWSSAEGDVNHPREVRIDPSSGKVFVSGSGGISVFDTTRHALVKKIEFTDAKGESDIAMNMHVDSADGKLYCPP